MRYTIRVVLGGVIAIAAACVAACGGTGLQRAQSTLAAGDGTGVPRHASGTEPTAGVNSASSLAAAEELYLDVLNAATAMSAIDSGLFTEYQGRDRAAWQTELRTRRATLDASLAAIAEARLRAADASALTAMRVSLASLDEEGSEGSTGDDVRDCREASRDDLDYGALRKALVACFTEIGGQLRFEGGTVDRGSALQLLHEIEEPRRRKALFDAFAPLWQALNGRNEPASPYRRLIAMAAQHAVSGESEVAAAARAIGVEQGEVERWLLQVLAAWREATGAAMIEPWDYRFAIGEAGRALAARIPADVLVAVNGRFYRDLGADLGRVGVVQDLAVRPGKSPVAYTEFLVRGRFVEGEWQPTVARVVGTYPYGGLFSLNELVHEYGHAVQISAIRNRPAYTDWGDTLFVEAFADVPSWSVYEPAWQRRYLGADVPEAASLRALYGNVMLDVAWALFEIRMLRAPASDPNALWSEITSRYLGIVPHPEVPWWAMRVQLVSDPGYMVNYGLGAVLTAEMRQSVADAIGPFDAGNPAWYGWLSERLLVYGAERDTRTLLRSVLGRPVSPEALIAQVRRCGP